MRSSIPSPSWLHHTQQCSCAGFLPFVRHFPETDTQILHWASCAATIPKLQDVNMIAQWTHRYAFGCSRLVNLTLWIFPTLRHTLAPYKAISCATKRSPFVCLTPRTPCLRPPPSSVITKHWSLISIRRRWIGRSEHILFFSPSVESDIRAQNLDLVIFRCSGQSPWGPPSTTDHCV